MIGFAAFSLIMLSFAFAPPDSSLIYPNIAGYFRARSISISTVGDGHVLFTTVWMITGRFATFASAS